MGNQASSRKDGFGTEGIGEGGDADMGTAGTSAGGTGGTSTGGNRMGGRKVEGADGKEDGNVGRQNEANKQGLDGAIQQD